MADELKATVINMKSLSQNIPDPVVVGAGDANGRTLRIIFTQEAAAQLADETKVYLSWYHQEQNVKGYNVFTDVTDEEADDVVPTWEITYPRSMLYEGNVLACIQLVDSISIATSVNFTIHVLIDPNDGSTYTATDDFSEFQQAVISLATLSDEMKAQMAEQKIEFEDMQLEFMDVRLVAQNAESAATQAKEISEEALQVSQTALNTIIGLTNVAREAKETAESAVEKAEEVESQVQELSERMDNNEQITEAIKEVATSAKEIAEAIAEKECCCGVTEEEMEEAIAQAKEEMSTDIDDALEQALTIRTFI